RYSLFNIHFLSKRLFRQAAALLPFWRRGDNLISQKYEAICAACCKPYPESLTGFGASVMKTAGFAVYPISFSAEKIVNLLSFSQISRKNFPSNTAGC
ncbi:MAG: hypothetical protein ACI4J7_11615, partial [Ruminiclostridium sp.]